MITKRGSLSNIKPYSLETKIHISLINSYAPKVHSFFLYINLKKSLTLKFVLANMISLAVRLVEKEI